MQVQRIKKIFKRILVFLQGLVIGLAVILVGSQYIIISDQMPMPLTSLDQMEGVNISQYGEELLVGQTPDKVYYVQMKYTLPNDLAEGAIKVFVDHQIISVLKASSITVALSEGQVLSLDASQLEDPLNMIFSVGDGVNERIFNTILQPNTLQTIQWSQD